MQSFKRLYNFWSYSTLPWRPPANCQVFIVFYQLKIHLSFSKQELSISKEENTIVFSFAFVDNFLFKNFNAFKYHFHLEYFPIWDLAVGLFS